MRLTDRVHLVGSGRLGFGLSDDCDSHVYAVDGGAEIALIDAGGGRATGRILEHLVADGLDPARVRSIVLTHAHGDHAAGVNSMRAALAEIAGTAPRVIASRDCAPWIEQGDESAVSLVQARAAGVYPADFTFPACPVDRAVSGGDRIGVGDLTLRAVETPGHARGHLSFLMATASRVCLFAGDALFFGGRVALQNIWDCSPTESAASVERLHALEWDAFFPGHLSFSVRDGHRHADAAMEAIRRLGMPPPLIPA
jgi:glyoxylase-like metal-dependent hydrolase (beta-lactamase superfamily II)